MSITPLYAGILALWFLVLSIKVVGGRRGGNIYLGDGGDQHMQRLIRGHANFAEYTPMILLLMALLELSSAIPGWSLHLIGLSLVAARVLHGYALSFSSQFVFGRVSGALTSFALLLVTGALNIWAALFSA